MGFCFSQSWRKTSTDLVLQTCNEPPQGHNALKMTALLICSNIFMTLAWYGHIAFKSQLQRYGIVAIVLISWGIALFEYCFQVPANRIGSAELGGPFTLWQLKVIQEVISLVVFTLLRVIWIP